MKAIVPLSRRNFVQAGLAASSLIAAQPSAFAGPPKRLLLRSSWQTVNIGDIAHTPGVLALLEKHLPMVEVRLWPSSVGDGVKEMLASRFPKVALVQSAEEIRQAFDECDFMLHGSGPSLVAEKHLVQWATETQKPYGVYGITLPTTGSASTKPTDRTTLQNTIDVLTNARFVYFRDSLSLQLARDLGCQSTVMEFGPDGAFGTDLNADDKASKFLSDHQLEPGKFLCCIPRLRYTPYWMIPAKKQSIDPIKHERNQAMKEHDHAPHREAIIRVVRETDMKILVCPEDQTQMAVGKELIVDPLPADVKQRVVWRSNYWLTDEALSTYRKSAGLFGNEMHSPIMCIGNGIPAIVCRWKEQTTKGFMWKDIGLVDWLFDFDNEDDIKRLPETVLSLATNRDAARTKALQAQSFVAGRQKATMDNLRRELGL